MSLTMNRNAQMKITTPATRQALGALEVKEHEKFLLINRKVTGEVSEPTLAGNEIIVYFTASVFILKEDELTARLQDFLTEGYETPEISTVKDEMTKRECFKHLAPGQNIMDFNLYELRMTKKFKFESKYQVGLIQMSNWMASMMQKYQNAATKTFNPNIARDRRAAEDVAKEVATLKHQHDEIMQQIIAGAKDEWETEYLQSLD